MSKVYRAYEPDQMFLLPPSLLEWLPKDHLVFFLRDVLETIDLSPITSVYEDETPGLSAVSSCDDDGDTALWVLERCSVVAQAGKTLPGGCGLPSLGGQQHTGLSDHQRFPETTSGDTEAPVCRDPSDVQLKHMLTLLPKRPRVFTADAGYGKDHCLKLLRRKRINAFVAVDRERHGPHTTRAPRGRIPKSLTLKERMQRKLLTLKGRRTYALRKTILEPVIGQIKNVMGFREFSLRGQDNARNEWFLVTGAHNLWKLFRACIAQPRRRKLLFAT